MVRPWASVRGLFFIMLQLETETQALASELQDTVNETHSFNSRSVQLLDKIDEVLLWIDHFTVH